MAYVDLTAAQFEGRVFASDIMTNFNKLLSTTTDPLNVKFGTCTLTGALTGTSASFSGNVKTSGKFNVSAATELTIASGAVTITKSYHTIDTEGDAASDDLTTINGGSEGDILILRTATSSRVVTVVDGGTLVLNGNFVMDSQFDRLVLIKDGSNWYEICRSSNN